MRKLLQLVIGVLVMVFLCLPAYAQEAATQETAVAPAKATISGEVVSVDADKSIVVVKQLKDAVLGVYEDVSLEVLPEAKITRGEEAIGLADLAAGNNILAVVVTDDKGGIKAESIVAEKK